MREYYYHMNMDPFDVLPLTFLVKSGSSSAESDFHRFQLYFGETKNEIRRCERIRNIEVERRTNEIKKEM